MIQSKVNVVRLALIALVVLLPLIFGGCGNAKFKALSINVETVGGKPPAYVFGNGKRFTDENAYQNYVGELWRDGYMVTQINYFEVTPISTSNNGYDSIRQPLRIQVPSTNYYIIVLRPHRGNYIGNCIHRYNVLHMNFIINQKGGGLIGDLHVAVWRENNRPCVGIYLSPQGWCTRFCGPSYTQVKNALASALIGAVGLTAAYLIATSIAPIAVPVLAL